MQILVVLLVPRQGGFWHCMEWDPACGAVALGEGLGPYNSSITPIVAARKNSWRR
jgi:hypothetical protein